MSMARWEEPAGDRGEPPNMRAHTFLRPVMLAVIGAMLAATGAAIVGGETAKPASAEIAGALDPSFGTKGWSGFSFRSMCDSATSVVQQFDGKLVVLGSVDLGVPGVSVTRYTP